MFWQFQIAFTAMFMLIAGPAAAQDWRYLTPEQSGQTDLHIAGLQYRGNSVSIEIDYKNSKLVMAVATKTVSKTNALKLIVERGGGDYVREIPSNTFNVFPNSNSSGGTQIALWLLNQDLEALMSGDRMIIRHDNGSIAFPLNRSRQAISQLIDVGRNYFAQAEDDRQHSIVQSISDCDQQAAHPWDNRHKMAGKSWGELDAETAIQSCRFAVENTDHTNMDVQTRVRMMYQLGRALDKAKNEESIKWIFKAGENYGYPIALNHLALLYQYGDYADKDTKLAERFYRSAVKKGNNPARVNLAKMMMDRSSDSNSDEWWDAYLMLMDAVREGYPSAMERVGTLIIDGRVNGGKAEQGVQFLEIASQKGNDDASLKLAHLYRDGDHVPTSATKYLHYLKIAANQGNSKAKKELE